MTATASAIGPLLVSIGFDKLGDYFWPFTVMATLLLIGIPVFLLAKPPVRKTSLIGS